MPVFWFLLGKLIRLASIAASLYLIWRGRWLVILMAIGFGFVPAAVTLLVNQPMKVFWRELSYPEGLTTPGLQLLVNPLRLMIVSRAPQLVYGGLACLIGLGTLLLFGWSSHTWERAASMIAGYESGFAVPTAIATTLIAEKDLRGMFLSAQLLYAKLAFLTLVIAHFIVTLSFWGAAALLTVVMLLVSFAFEFRAWRKPLAAMISGD